MTRKSFTVHRNAAVRMTKAGKPMASKVKVITVHPGIMTTARRIARGNAKLIRIKGWGKVEVGDPRYDK